MMSSRRARARTPTAPSSSSRTKWNGMRSSSVRFSQVSTGRRGRPGVQTRRRRACESYRNDGLEGKSTTVIAQAMGGGQPEDTSARNSRVAGQHPQPSPRGHVVIFLPALNEERAIGHVLQRIPKAQLEAAGYTVSVWVVDGNSTDRTLEVIRKSGASVFVQTGRGKGNGMRQAFDHLLRSRDRADGGSREPEFYFMFDADGTYPPEMVPEFLEVLASGQDVVLGSRFLGKMAEGAMSNLNRVGNRILSALARLLFGVSVTDVCTGMWAFNADTLRELSLEARGFDLEADLFGSAALKEARITELPIDYAARIGPPKLIPLRTGLKIALRLFKRRLNGPSTSPEHRSKPSRASRTTS
ncbi:MAG: glycosyltransferase [Methanobacteriota archaeon]|nr:MAG: glycosyltransferase [Euryarchaeota archaeon]